MISFMVLGKFLLISLLAIKYVRGNVYNSSIAGKLRCHSTVSFAEPFYCKRAERSENRSFVINHSLEGAVAAVGDNTQNFDFRPTRTSLHNPIQWILFPRVMLISFSSFRNAVTFDPNVLKIYKIT